MQSNGFILAVVVLVVFTGIILAEERVVAGTYDYTNIRVTEVRHDNNIIKLENGENVRLIGVSCLGCEASKHIAPGTPLAKEDIIVMGLCKKSDDFLKKMIKGKKVRLEFDVTRQDKDGELLAYVYLPWKSGARAPYDLELTTIDGNQFMFVNATMIKNGYTILPTSRLGKNLKYKSLFLRAYSEQQSLKK